MKNKRVYLILMVVVTIGFWLFENLYTPKTYGYSTHSAKEVFPEVLLPSSTSGDVIVHEYYMLSYKEPYEQAEWVAYTLKKEHLTYDDRQRPYFVEDPKVRTKSADWRNYKNSGYDRGHLCPAGDRRFSEVAYNETFYTSNISPQNRDFNAGIWNELEKKVRFWCKAYGELYVITGGVLQAGLVEIGNEDVDVPNYYYKIIAKKNNTSVNAIAFLIPNRPVSGKLQNYLVSIDSLEGMTQIDFFESLSKTEQQRIEAQVHKAGWKF